jgi:hypothetical protein
MGYRSRRLVAVAVAALVVTSACGGEKESSAAGSAGDADNPKAIASADEVIKVVDKGFVTYRNEVPGASSDQLSYGFVIENVSDEVALKVRVDVEFTDEAGNPIPDLNGGHEFTVVLPGQQVGSGDTEEFNGPGSGDELPPVAGMDAKIELITSLDTPDGKHRNPPGPWTELETGDPVVLGRNKQFEEVAVEVTNTYDVPLRPKATAVVRDAEGVIVGGMASSQVEQPVQPGDSVRVEFIGRPVDHPRLAEVTIECYADPVASISPTSTPVWHDI